MNKALIPIIAFFLLLMGLALAMSMGDRKTLDFAMQGKTIPDFELTELYSPDTVLTENNIYGEMTVINVFGTWCPPCAVEHPVLVELSEKHSVRFVGVAWQRRNTREDAIRWLDRLGDPYDLVIFDQNAEFALPLGIAGAPETFLVDAKGVLREKYVGPMTHEVWENQFLPYLQEP